MRMGRGLFPPFSHVCSFSHAYRKSGVIRTGCALRDMRITNDSKTEPQLSKIVQFGPRFFLVSNAIANGYVNGSNLLPMC
jgi:hypothetical protein